MVDLNLASLLASACSEQSVGSGEYEGVFVPSSLNFWASKFFDAYLNNLSFVHLTNIGFLKCTL